MTINTLLIANRGEIAVRIIATARRMGIRTVAVYSDADRDALHVRAADVAVHIGPTPASQSYLDVDAILEAARVSGADAIHPGYGFLSERAHFARAVTDAGLIFVGPPAAVIEQMGRKDHARAIAERAGVPVVPRGEGAGFPVLVKAAAGGGGKGMRIVRSADEYDAAVAAAKREAASAFGDDTILIERYVENGRHVEVQVLADQHGNVVHLFERDCSAQRRHQKVLEEAPAPDLSDAVRDVLHTSAVALSREVGYTNAGTVEYLVAGEEVFFLEMNTRLQVEHPVTEAITGLDLVELQLRIASGEPLPFQQDELVCRGHAFEARVYAEDAFGGFLPQAGTATYVRWPENARVDGALESGSVVSTAYDPMLGKVIVHAPGREAARQLLISALDDTAILGLQSNVGFVRALAASEPMANGTVDTAWLDRHASELSPLGHETAAVFAVWGIADAEIRQTPSHPFGSADGWRSAGPAAPAVVPLIVDTETTWWTVSWRRIGGPQGEVPTRLVERREGRLVLEIDGVICRAAVQVELHRVEVVFQGHRFVFGRPDVRVPGGALLAGDGTVTAPMPGTVLAIEVAEGDSVEEGQVLGIMEAMKMELALKAPYAGTVSTVGAAKGDQVPLGHAVFVVDQ